jgi:hypothetical protein
MVPIPRNTNAQMRGNYENTLRSQLELGKYFYFHARVAYHPLGVSTAIGRTSDFVHEITVSYQEISRAGTTWTRMGNVTNRGPYTVALPAVNELETSRLTG